MTDIIRQERGGDEWVVRAGQLIDGTGAPPISDAVLHVKSGKVAAAGPASRIALPDSLPVLDLGEETVLPGLIDTHNHPSLRPQPFQGRFSPRFYDSQAEITARALRNLRADLLSGVTTVRVVGELDYVDVALARLARRRHMPLPRILPSGPWVAPPGGHTWIPEWWVGGQEQVRQAVRERIRKGSRLIKTSLLDESPRTTSYSDGELSALVEQAHAADVPVAAHCTGRWGASIHKALAAGVDCVEHAVPLDEPISELFLENDASISLTPFVYRLPWPPPEGFWERQDSAGSSREWIDYVDGVSRQFRLDNPQAENQYRAFGREFFPPLRSWMEQVGRAWRLGVRMAVGSDTPHGVLSLSIEFLVDCGISEAEAIVAATSKAAEICGLSEVTGTLTAGKRADFISVRGDPLRKIACLRDVHAVVRDGMRVDSLSYK